VNFEAFQTKVQSAFAAGIRLSVPAFKDGHVSWEDSPATFGGKDGQLKLSLVGDLKPETHRKIKTPAPHPRAGRQDIEQRTGFSAVVQVESAFPNAAKALDLAGRLHDALQRYEMQGLLAPVVQTWAPGPIRNVPVLNAGRREPRWIFEVKLRVEIDFVTEQGKESLGMINTVELTADLGSEYEAQNVRAQAPS
jgi:hypothetical protein